LLRTEAREIQWDKRGTTAMGVWVRNANESSDSSTSSRTLIKLKTDGKIVLGAGSVHSPAILMRSGKDKFLRNNGGLHITDHDIFAKAYTFQYADDTQRESIGAMKLQTYVKLPKRGSHALCNVSIDASSFLPREFLPNEFFRNEQFPKLIFAFIMPCNLNPKNDITLDKLKQPVVTINRESPFDNNDEDVAALRDLTKKAKKEIQDALNIEYIDDKGDVEGTERFFKPLELGGVAHELGTIPFPGATTSSCIDQNLKLRDHTGVYVCDLSIFPMSPEVNPTLTLAALALRLSRDVLLPRALPRPSTSTTDKVPRDWVWVMNQTGENIKIFISNNSGAESTSADKEMILGPGDDTSRVRKDDVTESVAVYRLKYNSNTDYLTKPTFWNAKAGELTVICDRG